MIAFSVFLRLVLCSNSDSRWFINNCRRVNVNKIEALDEQKFQNLNAKSAFFFKLCFLPVLLKYPRLQLQRKL
jgi:hypothetical protein